MDHMPANGDSDVNDNSEMISLPADLHSWEGLDPHRGRNLRQLAFVVAGIFFGAVIGAISAQPELILGALIGAFCGMLLGTIIGGIFAGRDASRETISRKELKLRVRALERLFRWCLPVSVISLIAGLGSLPFLAKSSSGWAFVLCLFVITVIPGFKAYTIYIGQKLQCYRQLLDAHSQPGTREESRIPPNN